MHCTTCRSALHNHSCTTVIDNFLSIVVRVERTRRHALNFNLILCRCYDIALKRNLLQLSSASRLAGGNRNIFTAATAKRLISRGSRGSGSSSGSDV